MCVRRSASACDPRTRNNETKRSDIWEYRYVWSAAGLQAKTSMISSLAGGAIALCVTCDAASPEERRVRGKQSKRLPERVATAVDSRSYRPRRQTTNRD